MTPPRESYLIVTVKALVLAATVGLYLWNMATLPGWIAAMSMAFVAALLARAAEPLPLRLWVTLALAALLGLGLGLVGRLVAEVPELSLGLSAVGRLVVSDAASLLGLTLAVVFTLRRLSARFAVASVLEAAFAVGSVAYAFLRHRDQMIHRPRVLSDWAWSSGFDPQVVLRGVGVAAAALAVLLLLKAERKTKLLSSLLVLLLLGGLIYWLKKDSRIDTEVLTNGLSLTSKEQNSSGDGKDGKGGQGGGRAGDPGASGGGAPPPPVPVAVAVFHDDFEPPDGILYFRQQVLSRFDGTRLVADESGRFDQDVLVRFPKDHDEVAPPVQSLAFHVQVPTSMYLLVDHPQALALSSSIKLEPLANPDPRRFVAAYSAISYALTLPLSRLAGRASVPASWTPEEREHYLKTPDDPRYAALADEILRDIDPRFADDDIMKALLIKQYLEREGFYTRKVVYNDKSDPTAAFLFGDLRGYCVHFAHAAALLLRSQGIAARVALGYGVDMNLRGGGSAVLIMGDRAHAWPEIFVDGVGWVTFDIYPERSDEPPPQVVQQSLESLLGELARKDRTGGRTADPDEAPFEVPWALMGRALLGLMGGLLALAYAVKGARRLRPRWFSGPRQRRFAYIATLDRLADSGGQRRPFELREAHAARLAARAPSLVALTERHLREAFGGEGDEALLTLAAKTRREWAQSERWWQRLEAWLNPVGWWWSR